jgi:hypothetical protein
MSSVLVNTLREAAVTTFEQVVFLLPDTPPDEQQLARPVRAVASILFTGPASGMLQVHACEGLLPRLLANMLGQELDSEVLQLDALGEIANIICGQMFPHLDPGSAFTQNPPQVVVCTDYSAYCSAEPAAHVELGLEGSRADVLLYLHSAA